MTVILLTIVIVSTILRASEGCAVVGYVRHIVIVYDMVAAVAPMVTSSGVVLFVFCVKDVLLFIGTPLAPNHYEC